MAKKLLSALQNFVVVMIINENSGRVVSRTISFRNLIEHREGKVVVADRFIQEMSTSQIKNILTDRHQLPSGGSRLDIEERLH